MQDKNAKLTTQQIDAVFTSTSITTSLQCLDLGHNDLSSVDPALLARAVTKITEVGLRYTRLSSHQVEAVLASLDRNTQLKKLSLRGNQAAPQAEPKLLIEAVTSLEEVDLAFTKPTRQQKFAILQHLLANTGAWSLQLTGEEENEKELLNQSDPNAEVHVLLVDYSFNYKLRAIKVD